MINVIIFDEAKTLHFVEQMYKSDYFTEEQMTKYVILSDTNKVCDKKLAHFTGHPTTSTRSYSPSSSISM